MRVLAVVSSRQDLPLKSASVELVEAREYLVESAYSELKRALVFNLCRTYRYQSEGYYVSLLAAARGHRHIPSVNVMLGMRSAPLVRQASEELDDLIQKSFRNIKAGRFTLSVYFGRNLARRHERLSRKLFDAFPMPLLRALFVRDEEGKWRLARVGPIAARDVPENHHEFLTEAAAAYFSRAHLSSRGGRAGRYGLAILHAPAEATPPSDAAALRKFLKAARKAGFDPDLIDRDDAGHIAEYDALFIRETTAVQGHTFRLAQRAAAEGLAVIDDPVSILCCANKVYLQELLSRRGVPTPKTLILHEDNFEKLAGEAGFPVILKQPDGAFSQGVFKAENEREYLEIARRMLEGSDLVLAQEFSPTPYDWRVGVLDRKPLYVCRYFMAHRHWQIIKKRRDGRIVEGRSETLPVEQAPRAVVETAVAAANLIGDGLYGVDLKEINGRPSVIEINDNPNIDSGCEDAVLKDRLYLTVMESLMNRVRRLREER